MDPRKKQMMLLMFHQFFWMCIFMIWFRANEHYKKTKKKPIRYSLIRRKRKQLKNIEYITRENTLRCKYNIRLNITAFDKFCSFLHNVGGLNGTKYVTVREQVAMFLTVLAHHKKIRVVATDYLHSGDTVSKCFYRVLTCLMKLHPILMCQPEPIPADYEDDRWSCFPGCIGALDGTYVNVNVPMVDKPRYRNRKGDISTNVLVACDVDGGFTYALVGWEGSAADGRVLRDAIHRPNGLKVPTGTYYLCDNGYTNGDGFLTPYRGVRYHLKEWGVGMDAPQNYQEYFNMKHSQARNVIERSFGQMKKRWAVLRSNAFYPLKTQNRMIMALLLIHNFMRKTMGDDLLQFDPYLLESSDSSDDENEPSATEYIDVVEPSTQWNNFRDNLARQMFMKWNLDRA